MKIYSLIFVVLIVLSGCASKSYVKVVDSSVSRYIDIDDVKERIREDGLKELQVSGENETDEYILLRYRVEWKDKDGFEVPSISTNWRDLPVHKNANFSINIIAPNKKAYDYQLFIDKKGD